MKITIELFRDKAKKWRWRLRAGNGRILASSEAYSSRRKCIQTASLVNKSAAYWLDAPWVMKEVK